MRLEISSRTGKFNLLSSDEQVSCHICVWDGNERVLSTNLRLDYEENPSLPRVEDAIYLLEECIGKMFIDTSRVEKEELLKFLKENEEEIDRGTKEYRVGILKKEIEKRQEEIESLSTN